MDEGCGLPLVARSAPDANVILVSVDTLRADRLGCYGCTAPTSPAIDEFRKDAVLFETAIAQAPSTLASHASIFTSLIPSHHGASVGATTTLPDELQTIAEVLQSAGFATAAFTGGGQLARIFGVAQGFDHYGESRQEDSLVNTVANATEWLESNTEKPFFLFLHTYEVHHPYTPDPDLLRLVGPPYSGDLPTAISRELLLAVNSGEREIDKADLRHIVACYDAEIRSADQGFAQLVSLLREAGAYDDTLLILTSDHGEEFGEHGVVGEHSHTLYDELLKVPLIVKFPNQWRAGRSVPAQVRLLDLAPTISATVGAPASPQFQGLDLRRLIDSESTSDLQAVSQQDSDRGYRFSSLRSAQWKLYPAMLFDRHPFRGESLSRRGTFRLRSFFRPYRLFNLVDDAAETHDVRAKHPDRRDEMALRLRARLESRQEPATTRVTVDGTTEEQLRALGYLQ